MGGCRPYLGAANTYLATVENPPAVPTILFGLLIPLAIAASACGSPKASQGLLRYPAALARRGSDLSRRGRHLGRALGADGPLPWQFALPAGIAMLPRGSFAIVVAAQLATKRNRARSGNIRLVHFRNRRPRSWQSQWGQ